MQKRIANLIDSIRANSKSPITISLFIAFIIVGTGMLVTHGDGKSRAVKSSGGLSATSTVSLEDEEFARLIARIPQLVATSGTSTLSDEQKKYFEEYLKSEGDHIGAATVKTMMAGIDKSKFQARYTLKDLIVVDDDRPEALRAYAHVAGTIADKYAALKVKRPEDIVPVALKSKSREALLGLGAPATAYHDLSEELRKLPVPRKVASAHLAVVNGYDVMSRSLVELVNLFDSPALGAAAWQSYTYQSFYMTRGFAQIVKIIHDAGVTFTDPKDPSYDFRWRK